MREKARRWLWMGRVELIFIVNRGFFADALRIFLLVPPEWEIVRGFSGATKKPAFYFANSAQEKFENAKARFIEAGFCI